VSDQTCPTCNAALGGRFKFCPQCGGAIADADSAQNEGAAESESLPSAAPAPPNIDDLEPMEAIHDVEPAAADSSDILDNAARAALDTLDSESTLAGSSAEIAAAAAEAVARVADSAGAGAESAAPAEPTRRAAAPSLPPSLSPSLQDNPVQLEIKLADKLEMGSQGVLEIKLSNRTATGHLPVRLEVNSSLHLPGSTAYSFDLQAGLPMFITQRFETRRQGQHTIKFLVRPGTGSASGASPMEFEGHLTVNVSGAAATTQVINFTDARRIEGRVVVGTEGGNMQVGSPVAAGDPSTDEFVEVALRPRQQIRALQLKRILAGHEHRRVAATRLSLLVRDDAGIRNVCLLACPRFSLGKRRDNDVVLRVLPPGGQNDGLSARITRAHAAVEFTPHGAVWRNNECINGTLVGGAMVAAGQQCLLQQGVEVRPAAVMGLSCDLINDDPTEGEPGYAQLATRVPAPPTAEPVLAAHPWRDTVGPVKAVRLRRSDSLAGLEEYVAFQRGAAVGGGPNCAVQLQHASVYPVHAKIVSLGGSLWIEPCQSVAPTLVDNDELPLDQLAPLRPNLLLRLGEVEITVTRFQQYYLDIAPPS